MNTIWSKWISYEYHMNIIQTFDEYPKTKNIIWIPYDYQTNMFTICLCISYRKSEHVRASRAQQNTTTAQLQLQSADQASNRTNIILMVYADQMNIM